MSDNLSYPTGLASLFAGHARNVKIISQADVTAAFEKMWNTPDGAEFIHLYENWQKLAAEYARQNGQQP